MSRLSAEEKASYERDGFLVRRGVFTSDEIAELIEASEELCRDLAAAEGGNKIRVSQDYVFEPDATKGVIIKWEPGAQDVVQGVEPCVHLHPVYEKYRNHPQFVEPMKDILDLEDVDLFTEKLNLKRARAGGKYALHQDFPYWGEAEEADRMCTCLVALDEATLENGALQVHPGSHTVGVVPGKDSEERFERLEIDPAKYPTDEMISVEMKPGDAVFFGPFLVHTSPANPSDKDRRALLYTYQRAGNRTSLENLRRVLSRSS
jgi:hypothetical protein